jgi:hypothetical protein
VKKFEFARKAGGYLLDLDNEGERILRMRRF